MGMVFVIGQRLTDERKIHGNEMITKNDCLVSFATTQFRPFRHYGWQMVPHTPIWYELIPLIGQVLIFSCPINNPAIKWTPTKCRWRFCTWFHFINRHYMFGFVLDTISNHVYQIWYIKLCTFCLATVYWSHFPKNSTKGKRENRLDCISLYSPISTRHRNRYRSMAFNGYFKSLFE